MGFFKQTYRIMCNMNLALESTRPRQDRESNKEGEREIQRGRGTKVMRGRERKKKEREIE